jgi:hypothetical protein
MNLRGDIQGKIRSILGGNMITLADLKNMIDELRMYPNSLSVEYMSLGDSNADSVSTPRNVPRYTGGAYSPDDLTPMFAEQKAWENMNTAYNKLDPEYRRLLPTPDPAPVSSLTEPFNRYIEENAEEDPLEEGRAAIGMLSPDDVNESLNDLDSTKLDHITPLYEKALPRVGPAWIPIMVRADMLKTLLN